VSWGASRTGEGQTMRSAPFDHDPADPLTAEQRAEETARAYDPPEEDTVARHLAEVYERNVTRIANRLREAADRVERYAEPRRNLTDMQPDFLGASGSIVHEVANTFPNLGLDGLMRTAQEAHDAARGRP
jgi:hypothetical protein